MLKKAALLIVASLAIGAIAVAGLYLAGYRVALDGSGMRPRFVSRGPNYDALESDRARQRERAMPQAAPTQGAAPIDRGPERPSLQGATERPALQGETERPAPQGGNEGPARQLGSQTPAPQDAPPPHTDVTAALKTMAAGGARRGYWPDFRGPRRDGRYDETAIRTDWPGEGLRRLWKQPIGLGYASFVVADGRAFTIEQRRQQEVVSAYDVDTGRELWTHGWPGAFVETLGGDGPRATPTYDDGPPPLRENPPSYGEARRSAEREGGRIYALGALGELRCLDARTGALIWRRNILTDNGASNLPWGMSAAPLVVDDKVVVLPGGPSGKSVVAYRKTTGEPVWTSLDDPQAYTSPMLVTLAGVRQILVVTARRAVGLTVNEGRLLWDYPWVTEMAISVAQPLLLGNDRVFLSAAYGHGAAVFEVTPTRDGFTTRTVWESNRMKNKFTSSVLHHGYIYGLDEAILACLDAATGELKWKGGRYGYGQVILAGDRLVVLTEDGDVALVKATPERFEQEARFSAISGKTWNHPVIADGRLLVRNLREMAAFDIRPR